MKFRAVMNDGIIMREFMNIVSSISKLSKECVLRLVEDKIYFIIAIEDNGPRRPLVWCELPVNHYFKKYSLTGVNENYNEIYLECATVLLARSLTSLRMNPKSMQIKLTNKQTPCLTFEIELCSQEELQSRLCVHDVPVDVIPRAQWGDYEEPHFNDFHASIQLPNLRAVKNIIDRMKNVSHTLIVSANKHGRLTLRIKTNMVTMSAHFPELHLESFAGEEPQDSGDEEESDSSTVSATVDIRKFLMFLSGLQSLNCRTVCSIVQGKMVKLFLEQPGALSFQCFLTEMSV